MTPSPDTDPGAPEPRDQVRDWIPWAAILVSGGVLLAGGVLLSVTAPWSGDGAPDTVDDRAAALDTRGTAHLVLELILHPPPPGTGGTALSVSVRDAAGRPVRAARVTLSADPADGSGRGIRVTMIESAPGEYQARPILPESGVWRFTASVQHSSGQAEAVVEGRIAGLRDR